MCRPEQSNGADDVRAGHRGAAPRLTGVLRVASVQSGRGDEELEAFRVCLRHPVPLVHVPAADPLGTGRDADLVGTAVVTVQSDRSSGGVRPMAVVVTRRLVVVSTRIAGARVDGV